MRAKGSKMANKKHLLPYRFVPLPRGVYAALDGLPGRTVTLYLWLYESMNTYKTPGRFETFALTSNGIHIKTGWQLRSIQRGIRDLLKNNIVSRKPAVGGSFIIEFRTDFDSESGDKSGASCDKIGASCDKSVAVHDKSVVSRDTRCRLPKPSNSPQTAATTGPKASSGLAPLYYSLDAIKRLPLIHSSKLASGGDKELVKVGKSVGRNTKGEEVIHKSAEQILLELSSKIESEEDGK